MVRMGFRRLRLIIVGSLGVFAYYTLQLLVQENYSHDGRTGKELDGTSHLVLAGPKNSTLLNGKRKNNSEAKVYRWRHGKWVRIPRFCSRSEDFALASLKTSVGNMKMYIHDIARDVHVSGSLKRTGLWDSVGVYTMIARLKLEPEMGLIDIGAQLGTFSFVAAMMGRDVIAVDPLVENVLRMCKTIEMANLTERITILYTAISDTRTVASFRRLENNLGGTHILEVKKKEEFVNMDNNYNRKYVNTVTLDDLIPFVKSRKEFIKIDVEGHEYEALKEGRQLFKDVHIRGILMEWFQVRSTKKGYNLKNLLYSLNFQAEDPLRRGQLHPNKSMSWPTDVLWMQKDTYLAKKRIS